MDDVLKEDLRLSHAFLNVVSADYEGIYVFFNARHRLDPESIEPGTLEEATSSLDVIHGWWRGFDAHQPLVRRAGLDDPPESFRKAREWIDVSQDHLEGLVSLLSATSRLDRLGADLDAVHIRAAAACDAAYARQHYVKGLVRYGEVLGEELVADRWRQHLLSCQAQVREAHWLLERASGMGATVDEAAAEEMLDVTLALPAVLAQRIMDIREVRALAGPALTFETAGIPGAEVRPWSDRGFSPIEAGRWYTVGWDPDDAVTWINGGVPDPVWAFEFSLREFDLETAAWLAAGFAPREAAGRRRAGEKPADREP